MTPPEKRQDINKSIILLLLNLLPHLIWHHYLAASSVFTGWFYEPPLRERHCCTLRTGWWQTLQKVPILQMRQLRAWGSRAIQPELESLYMSGSWTQYCTLKTFLSVTHAVCLHRWLLFMQDWKWKISHLEIAMQEIPSLSEVPLKYEATLMLRLQFFPHFPGYKLHWL